MKITVTADRDESTKTLIDAAHRQLLWGSDEHLAIYELRWTWWDDEHGIHQAWRGYATKSEQGQTYTGGRTMFFDATIPLEPNESGKSLIYTALYPISAINGGIGASNSQTIELPAIQDDVEGSFDPGADILYAQPVESDVQLSDLHFRFSRLSSIGRITLRNVSYPGKITCVKIESVGNVLSGPAGLDLETGAMDFSETEILSELSNSVSINVLDRNVENVPELECWFCTWPVSIDNSFTVTVYNDQGRMWTRDVHVGMEPLVFEQGKATAFTVDMGPASSSSYSVDQSFTIDGYNYDSTDGLHLEYDDIWGNCLNVHSFSDWYAEVIDGADWFSLGGNARMSFKGAGDPINTTQLFYVAEKNEGDAPRYATVRLRNNFEQVTFNVTQGYNANLRGVSIQPTLTLTCGDTHQLEFTTVPLAYTNYNVYWSSSDEQVAYVDPDTGFVTARVAGTATITVSVSDNASYGSFDAECVVTVNAPSYTEPTDYYFVVSKVNNNNVQLALVHNGAETVILDGYGQYDTRATALEMVNNNVLVAGSFRENSSIGSSTAFYWTNGTVYLLNEYLSIISVAVDGNDVYALAQTWEYSVALLKNWVKIAEQGEEDTWNYLAADDGNWYIYGWNSDWDNCYWCNGAEIVPPELDGYYVNCIAVENGKVYLGGEDGDYRAMVWYDDTVHTLTTSEEGNRSTSMVNVSGDDVWCLVNGGSTAYKNGVPVYFPRLDNYSYSTFVDSRIFGGQLYILTSVSNKGYFHESQLLYKTLYNMPVYIDPAQKDNESDNSGAYTQYTNLLVK